VDSLDLLNNRTNGKRPFPVIIATMFTLISAVALLTSATHEESPVPFPILAFHNIKFNNACLYVPTNSIAAYRAADWWKEFKCIKAIAE